MPTGPDGIFDNSDSLSLFPTPVWKLRLEEARRSGLGEAVRARISRHLASEHGLSQGQRWQSSADLQHDPALQAIREPVFAAAQLATAQLHIARDRLSLTGCWAAVHARGAELPPTSHANNYFAGLYWVQAPPGANAVRFHDPRPQAAMLRPPLTRSSRENALLTALRCEPGSLLLFPAWLAYSMPANESFETRVLLGFTLMFEDYVNGISGASTQGGGTPN